MADNRENTILQAISEGESVDSARTSDEVFLKAIADSTEKPEEIRNRLQYWLNQIDSGGGNPNYVETVTGNLANPWGSIDIATLYEELAGNAASIILTASIDVSTVTVPIVAETFSRRFNAVTALDYNEGLQTYLVAYDNSGSLLLFIRATAFSDSGSIDSLTSVAATVPTTLTIIHHPLP